MMDGPFWHKLKTDPAVFAAVLSGEKTHEIRYNDRHFKVGDELLLLETRYSGDEMRQAGQAPGKPLEYTGRQISKRVSHILTGYGLMPGWVILSFAPDAAAEEQRVKERAKAALEQIGAIEPAFPERGHNKRAEEQGLFHKFDIRRVDGKDLLGGKHQGCRYFVLDLTHDEHAAAAMRAYGEACKVTHPQLAADIFAEFGRDLALVAGDLAPQLLDMAKKAEADRQATTNPNQERIYLGARDAFEIAAHMANKAAKNTIAPKSYPAFGRTEVPRLVTHAEGGQYVQIGAAHGAGKSRGQPPVVVYRGVDDGRLWFRSPTDFAERLK